MTLCNFQEAMHGVLTESKPWHQSWSASSMVVAKQRHITELHLFSQQLLMQGLAASGGRASVLGNAAAAAACEAVAVVASGSVEFTMPRGQAATAKTAEPAAEAVEEAAKSSASVDATQETVASAAGAKAVQEALESPAGSAHAANGPLRHTADSVVEASMSSAAERVASSGNSLHPPQPHAGAAISSAAEASSEAEQQHALVQAFTQAFIQRAMVAGTLVTSSAPEHVTAAVLSLWHKADDLQRGSATSGQHLVAIEASVASAKSAACPAADVSTTAAPSSISDGTAAITAPAAASPSSALEAGSTAAHLTSADETAAASTVDAAVNVSKPCATDAAKLDALHYAGAGPAKLQLLGQDDVPRLVGSGAFPTLHGCVSPL